MPSPPARGKLCEVSEEPSYIRGVTATAAVGSVWLLWEEEERGRRVSTDIHSRAETYLGARGE